MTNTVVIDIDGRLALPLRALAYVTGWAEAPDSIVRALSLEPTVRVGGVIQRMAGRRVEILNKNALKAFKMNADGTWVVIPHTQWHAVATDLSSLTKQLQADERQGAGGENHARWRTAATLALPEDAFVWLDEFERWFACTRPLAIPSDDDVDLWRSQQEQLYEAEDLALVLEEGMADFSRPAKLDFTVIYPAELKGRIWHNKAIPLEAALPANEMNKSRGGRPPTVDKKAAVILALMAKFRDSGASWTDPLQLPGSAADLLNAFQRIEKIVAKKNAVFQVTLDTFRGWLSIAGFGFKAGRVRDDEVKYWTQLAPQMAGKTSPQDFSII